MNRIFENFPKESVCKICGTSYNKPCILVPIDFTENGGNCEAIPIHVDCAYKLRYNKQHNLFYIQGK